MGNKSKRFHYIHPDHASVATLHEVESMMEPGEINRTVQEHVTRAQKKRRRARKVQHESRRRNRV